MKLVLVLETDAARDRFLAMAADALPAGERIVRAIERVGEHTMTVALPRDASAELVARELPLVLPGGFTALVSYYRVGDETGAVEVEMRDDGREERREIVLAAPTA